MHNVATSLLTCAALLAVQVPQVRAADDEPQVVPYDQDGQEDEYGSVVNPKVQPHPGAPVRRPPAAPSPAPRPVPAPLPAAPGPAAAPVPPGLAPVPGAPPPAPLPIAPMLPARQTPGEGGLGVMQFVLGMAAFGGTILLGASSDSEDVVVVGVLLAPLSTAGVVCLVGLSSEYNEGRCGPSIGFSYLGAAAGLLVGFAAAAASDFDDSGVMLLLGAPVVGAAIGAVTAWHSYKKPKLQPRLRALAVPELPRPLLRDRERIAHLTVPVLSLSF